MIPKDVLERWTEIAHIYELVAPFFDGDAAKTARWFQTRNPMLGNLSPGDMIRLGRVRSLRRFVMDALQENAPSSSEVRPRLSEGDGSCTN